MKFLDRVRTFSLSLAVLAGLLVLLPTRAGLADRGREDGAPRHPGCADCVAGLADQRPAGRSGATLSVNIAIVGLGMMWLALMLRRSQQHPPQRSLSTDDPAGAGPRRAAGGH